MTKAKLLTSKPRSLESARAFVATLLSVQASNLPLRFRPVIIDAETTGYHVCELGFATSNGFQIVR